MSASSDTQSRHDRAFAQIAARATSVRNPLGFLEVRLHKLAGDAAEAWENNSLDSTRDALVDLGAHVLAALDLLDRAREAGVSELLTVETPAVMRRAVVDAPIPLSVAASIESGGFVANHDVSVWRATQIDERAQEIARERAHSFVEVDDVRAAQDEWLASAEAAALADGSEYGYDDE